MRADTPTTAQLDTYKPTKHSILLSASLRLSSHPPALSSHLIEHGVVSCNAWALLLVLLLGMEVPKNSD